jgi:hypothetical protein
VTRAHALSLRGSHQAVIARLDGQSIALSQSSCEEDGPAESDSPASSAFQVRKSGKWHA